VKLPDPYNLIVSTVRAALLSIMVAAIVAPYTFNDRPSTTPTCEQLTSDPWVDGPAGCGLHLDDDADEPITELLD